MSRQGTARERTPENVKDFWNKEAEEWGESPRVTIRDHYFRLLEIAVICDLIEGRSQVLDIGCGTGLSTLFYSQHVKEIIGADYADKMVMWAQRLLNDPGYFAETMRQFAPDGGLVLRGNVRFEEGNILNLSYPDATFDTVIAERVLINLPQRELQDQAVSEVARVMQPSGRWIVVEVTEQGHQAVDQVRSLFGLPVIEKYWHNYYIEEGHFSRVAGAAGFEIKEIQRFETYQFLTKVMHPLIVSPAEPEFMCGFNNAARKISLAYPTYKSVVEIGLERFLKENYRPLVEELDPEKMTSFDRAVNHILNVNPNFTACSHQVLYVLKRQAG